MSSVNIKGAVVISLLWYTVQLYIATIDIFLAHDASLSLTVYRRFRHRKMFESLSEFRLPESPTN